MEEGEIADSRFKRNKKCKPKPGDVYDPAYEWPGEPSSVTLDATETLSSDSPPTKPQPTTPYLRLVVSRTSILSSKHKFAIIDGYSELQLGRDAPLAGVDVPKVRLKEMEVSKLHATVYWDAQRLEWSVVDMGSKHGTYLKPATSTPSSLDGIGSRLSPPRMASVPKRLRHLDRLTIGSTTFVIHIHSKPCEECSLAGEDQQIPLFHSTKAIPTTGSQKRSRETSPYMPQPERDPKKALNLLKQSLLSRHEQGASRSQSPQPPYVDRSARRRALHPSTYSDSPGVQPPAIPSTRVSSPGPTLEVQKPSPEPTSQLAIPLPSSNIGHRMLMKQGWAPGMALGTSDLESDEGRIGLVEPVEINPTVNRAGLGSKVTPKASWKEKGLHQRWDRKIT
ncbi:hypothetical protein APHAL10511_007355 [Amanita phalloides]|nr:hypothetical protein APHAL10511_007355 [Amanita phalloides]